MTRQLDSRTCIKPARFAHFVLRVHDLQRSIDWYATMLGMEVVHRNDAVAFMTYDEEHHRIALVKTPVESEAPPGAAGLDHVAYTFESLGDLLGSYRRLKEEGILPVWSINHGPTTSLYYADPDGCRVELQVDNYETEEDLKAFMKTESFLANPIGVGFDPDVLVRRYEAGDPLERLIEQGSA